MEACLLGTELHYLHTPYSAEKHNDILGVDPSSRSSGGRFSAGLHARDCSQVTSIWSVDIAILLADLVPFLDGICPSLITSDECRKAGLDWRVICMGLGEVAIAAFIIYHHCLHDTG